MYAEVLIEYNNKNIDKTFTYNIPPHLNLSKGMKVKVPFNNKLINGFILNITNEYSDNYKLQTIDSITDEFLILNDELLSIGNYLSEITLCSKIIAFQTMLPSALKVKNQNKNYQKYITYIELVDINNLKTTSHKQQEIIDILLKEKRIKKYQSSAINTLLKNNIIKEVKEEVYRINNEEDSIGFKTLTKDQQQVLDQIKLNQNKTYLLHGITGSGKTEVYIHLINKCINDNKTSLLLVPEITLTTQITKRLKEVFTSNVAIFHSALSPGEKYDEYLKALKGEVKIVVGTRSSIFTPLKNLGVIIIDEEHSDNYKQDTTPRYHALDIAKYRAEYNNIPLLIASATPTLESMARARKGVYELLELKSRIGTSTLPTVKTVDMNQEIKTGNWIISKYLDSQIKEKIANKEQIILLLNRRGHSTNISCKNCGFTHKCPHCDITLTYHKTSNNLRCHYCNYTIFKSDTCPECKEESMNFLGLGTEKLEQYLNQTYKDARVIRMDTDTTSNKGAHETIITDFQNQKYDILLGTQMVSKGLDFKNVTLVGIINADQSLNVPDFRSSEKTFSLLHQVSGRAGRGEKSGLVVIQTYNPNHFTIETVVENNYLKHYQEEMNIRKLLKYPPYYYLLSIKVASKEYETSSKEIIKIKNYISKYLKDEIILGPTMATNFRINNTYRFQLIIKYRDDKNIKKIIKELDKVFLTNNKAFLEIDFNPNQL